MNTKRTTKHQAAQGGKKNPKRADRTKTSTGSKQASGSKSSPHSAKPSRSKSAARCSETDETRCPVEDRCGACQLLHVPYEQQLTDKQAAIAELFDGLADEATVMHPIAGMADPFYYRNKVVSPYAPGRRIKQKPAKGDKRSKPTRADRHAPTHEILCGMYAAGTHCIVPTDSCLIENQVAKQIVRAIRDLMPAFRIEPYREDTNTGFLRHAVVRVGHTTGEVLVTLVTNGRQFPGSKALVRELVKRCPEITSIVQNINTRQTNVILGASEIRLYGPGFILDKLCGLSFRVSSQSFYQVNSSQTEALYRRAIELAQLTGRETVIDAYCGTGTIGLAAARGLDEGKRAAKVIGVDEVAAAIRDARENAKHNGIENAEFIADDAGSFMRRLAAGEGDSVGRVPAGDSDGSAAQGSTGSTGGAVDVVLMDPPRSGATENFLKALVALSPQRAVYISCNPQTQARDVAYLVERGYSIEAIQPVDMFPHTEHVENIVVCCKQA